MVAKGTGKEDADIEAAKKEIEKSLKEPEAKKEKAWYEKMKIRGYSQFRYNRIAETNPDVRSPQGERSIGEDGSFLIRRARMIFSGDAGERVSYYIQPDFASGATGPNPLHFLQIRDFYADVHLDMDKEHRLRIGQSKVPYGFENLQSSQNRLALDRNDALNSAVVNERDLGVFYYWVPSEIRSRFKSLVDDGLKGSGDYGVLGLGIYNGQTANRPERNDGQHVVGRISYPFLFANGQIFEPGLCGYTGVYTIERSAGIGGGDDFLDRRGAVSFTLYPQPLGLQGGGRGVRARNSTRLRQPSSEVHWRVATCNSFTRLMTFAGWGIKEPCCLSFASNVMTAGASMTSIVLAKRSAKPK